MACSAQPRDGDVGAVFGIGFPPFLGGPFRHIDHEGVDNIVRQLEMLHARFAPRFEPARAAHRHGAYALEILSRRRQPARMTASTSEFTELAAALSGQYALEREIGRGGMGVVYLARDEKLARHVAIKTLPRHMQDAATRDRFLREARTAASLSHPNIVSIIAPTRRAASCTSRWRT